MDKKLNLKLMAIDLLAEFTPFELKKLFNIKHSILNKVADGSINYGNITPKQFNKIALVHAHEFNTKRKSYG